jgi:hypothetical protein
LNRCLDAIQQPLQAAFEAQQLSRPRDATLAENADHVAVGEPALDRLERLADRFGPRIEEDEPPLVGEHAQEAALDVGPIHDHADVPWAGHRQQESIQPRQVVGHQHHRPRRGHEFLAPRAEPEEGVHDRGHEQPQRRPGSRVDGDSGGHEREHGEDAEHAPRRNQWCGGDDPLRRRHVGQPVARRHAQQCGGQRDHREQTVGVGEAAAGNRFRDRSHEGGRQERRLAADQDHRAKQ